MGPKYLATQASVCCGSKRSLVYRCVVDLQVDADRLIAPEDAGKIRDDLRGADDEWSNCGAAFHVFELRCQYYARRGKPIGRKLRHDKSDLLHSRSAGLDIAHDDVDAITTGIEYESARVCRLAIARGAQLLGSGGGGY